MSESFANAARVTTLKDAINSTLYQCMDCGEVLYPIWLCRQHGKGDLNHAKWWNTPAINYNGRASRSAGDRQRGVLAVISRNMRKPVKGPITSVQMVELEGLTWRQAQGHTNIKPHESESAPQSLPVILPQQAKIVEL